MIHVRGLILIGVDADTGEQVRIEAVDADLTLREKRHEHDSIACCRYGPSEGTKYTFEIKPRDVFTVVNHAPMAADARTDILAMLERMTGPSGRA